MLDIPSRNNPLLSPSPVRVLYLDKTTTLPPDKTLEWVRARGRDFRLTPQTAAAALLSPEYCDDSGDYDIEYHNDNGSDAEGELQQALFSRVAGSRAPRRQLPAGTPLLLDVGGMGDDEIYEEEEEEEEDGGRGDGFDLEAAQGDQEEKKAAELALEFSRALYGLLPLDRFPDEEIDADNVGEMVAKEDTVPGVDRNATGGLRGGLGLGGGGGGGSGSNDDLIDFGSSLISSGDVNRRTRRLVERKRKDGGSGGGGSGRFVGDAETERRRQEAPKKREPTALEIHEAALQAQLLERPFGDAALEALQRTLEQEGDVEGRYKMWSSIRGGVGGVSRAEAIGEDEREGFDVEAGARRTALWSVALGTRKDFPDSIRVRYTCELRGDKGNTPFERS